MPFKYGSKVAFLPFSNVQIFLVEDLTKKAAIPYISRRPRPYLNGIGPISARHLTLEQRPVPAWREHARDFGGKGFRYSIRAG